VEGKGMQVDARKCKTRAGMGMQGNARDGVVVGGAVVVVVGVVVAMCVVVVVVVVVK
jgi:hypothetical protein